ncbi:amidase [Aureimonas fodinaquatilis]|nr:amidase [Aureimonas fodinaquatilis]
MSLTETAEAIRTGAITPVSVVEAYLSRIAELDGQLHSFATVAADRALVQAHNATREICNGQWRGLLHGIPLGLKDAIYTTEIKTGLGSPVFTDWHAPHNATVVTRIEQAGGIVIGKLTLTEGVYADHHPTTEAPVNPWGPAHWTGTSSSGAGVAVAAGLCLGSLGTDTGGSIRLPSSCCGVVGIKPTWGRVSRYGVFPLAESLDHVGPMCRTVADSAAMLGAIAGADSADPTASLAPVPDYMATLDDGIAGRRIGIDWRYIRSRSTDEVVASIEAVLSVVTRLGAEIVPVSFPDPDDILRGWAVECAVEAAIAHEGLYPEQKHNYGPRLTALLERGHKFDAMTLARAQKSRRDFQGIVSRLFADVDMLIVPGLPVAGPTMDHMASLGEDPAAILAIGPFTAPFDVSLHPTITVPCGFSDRGIPIGFQFVGPYFSEALLCTAGHAYQTATDWHHRRPVLPLEL